MSKVKILMPSCSEPSTASDFILGGRLLEYLNKVEQHSTDAFFSFDGINGTIDIYVRREKLEEDSDESIFFIYSNDSFCDNIKNTFSIKNSTVEGIGVLVKEMYNIITDKAREMI